MTFIKSTMQTETISPLAIMGDTLMANNMCYTDDADHPVNIYYVIK